LEHAADQDLRRLVDASCDEGLLISHLATLRHVHPSLDTIEFWTGRSRRQAKSLKESFNGCARAADALLNKTPFKTILIGWIGSSEAATDLTLPHILRRWVGRSERAAVRSLRSPTPAA
jgi:hypothetical protein